MASYTKFDLTSRRGLLQFFDAADVDKNGYLSMQELDKALTRQGYNLSTGKLQKQFQTYDLDGNQRITKDEFMVCMGKLPVVKDQEANLKKMFKTFDISGDRMLEKSELKRVFKAMNPTKPTSDRDLDKMIDLMDTDADGKVDFDEFLAFFQKSAKS